MSERPGHGWGDRRTRTRLFALLVVVALINLPLVHHALTVRQVANDGVEVTATVTGTQVLGSEQDPRYFAAWRFDEEIDPAQRQWSAEVDQATYASLEEGGPIEVRVVPDDPAAYEVEGQVHRRLGLWLTLAADAMVLVVLLLLWRFGRHGGRYRVPEERVTAVTDVEVTRPGAVWEDLGDGTLMVVGEVVAKDGGEVLLDCDGRRVRVALGGHICTVGHQQDGRVRVRRR